MCVNVNVTGCINRADKPTQSSSVLKEDEECGTRPTFKWEAFSELRIYSWDKNSFLCVINDWAEKQAQRWLKCVLVIVSFINKTRVLVIFSRNMVFAEDSYFLIREESQWLIFLFLFRKSSQWTWLFNIAEYQKGAVLCAWKFSCP